MSQEHKDIKPLAQLRTEIANAFSMGQGLKINSERLHYIDAGLVLLRDSLQPVNINPLTHGEVCSECNWTNGLLLNLGEPGAKRMVCHGCCKRAFDANSVTPVEPSKVDHPAHYGGKDNPYEAIKVIEALGLAEGFCLGNSMKYIMRAGRKDGNTKRQDLQKAAWYINWLVEYLGEEEKAHHEAAGGVGDTPKYETLTNEQVQEMLDGKRPRLESLEKLAFDGKWQKVILGENLNLNRTYRVRTK